MTTYTARAHKWAKGWELHIEDVGVTQCRSLATAEQQVRDYLTTLLDIDATDAEITIVPEINKTLANKITRSRKDSEKAAELQRRAAEESRQIVAELHHSGYSGTDIAALLGISTGRVSQLRSDQHNVRIARTH